MSRYKLIEEELDYIQSKPTTLIDKFLWGVTRRGMIEYNISLPVSIYLRLQVFCEDIEELSEYVFTPQDLIDALYDDFLYFSKKVADIDKIYNQLMLQKEIIENAYPSTNEFAANDKRLIIKNNEIVSSIRNVAPSFVTIKIGIKRKKALRGEIVLADMEEQYPDHPFSLERIVCIMIIDFINEVKNGNAKVLTERILNNLNLR